MGDIIQGAEAWALLAALDPDAFPDWNAHPLYGAFQRSLYRKVFPDSHPDSSFVVMRQGEPAAVACGTLEAGVFSSFGVPASLCLRQGLTTAEAWRVCDTALKHIRGLLPEGGHALLRGGTIGQPGQVLDQVCAHRQAHAHAVVHAVAELELDEAELERQLRSSYRTEVRWGRTNLRMTHLNQANPDRALFDLYPAFHAKVAGRTMRGPDYWQLLYDEVVAGRSEMSLGWLDGQLASGTVVVDTAQTSYYASGVYDRSLFDRPISHWPVFDAMLRAKQRGVRWFDLGEIPQAGTEASDKELRIGFFKRGFTRGTRISVFWTLPKRHPAETNAAK
jgi:hypothetical protein